MGNEFYGLNAKGHIVVGAMTEAVCWSYQSVTKVIPAFPLSPVLARR